MRAQARNGRVSLLRLCVIVAALGSACSETSDDTGSTAPSPIIQDVSFVEGCWFYQGAEQATTATLDLVRTAKDPEVYAGDWRWMHWGRANFTYRVTLAVDGARAGFGRGGRTDDNDQSNALRYPYAQLPEEMTTFVAQAAKRATFKQSNDISFVVEEDRGTLAVYSLWRSGKIAYLFTGVRVTCS